MNPPKKPGFWRLLPLIAIVSIATVATFILRFHRSTENTPQTAAAPHSQPPHSATASVPDTAPAQAATLTPRNIAPATNTTPRPLAAPALLPPAGSAPSATTPAANVIDTLSPRDRSLLEKIPDARFRDEAIALDPDARFRLFKTLAANPPPAADYPSLRISRNGLLYYVCKLPSTATHNNDDPHTNPGISTDDTTPAAAPVLISQPPIRHSRPGSKNILFLDFGGMEIRDTSWNKDSDGNIVVPLYSAKPYSTDTNSNTFNDQEQRDIIEIWERVAEHFAPFDVDVTTEKPATFTRTTARALITSATDQTGMLHMPSADEDGVAGVAFRNVFAEFDFHLDASPAFIYHDRLSNNPADIAYAAAHELGHNLGLSHDGPGFTFEGDNLGYYTGHGSGAISWSPIMGAGYGRSVIQWSKGEYYKANNLEDDIAIIAGKLGYRDDLGATALATVANLTPDKDGLLGTTGIIRNAGFSHHYALNLASPSSITLALNPVRLTGTGTNIGSTDLRLEILDSTGNITHTAAPATITSATLTAALPDGRRYIRISSEGAGNPMLSSPTGYTSYGSIGQYALATNLVDSNPTLATALNSDLVWTTRSNSGTHWIAQTQTTHDGIAAAQTGPNLHGEISTIITTIEGTGTLTFWWKTSASEHGSLHFITDAQPIGGGTSVASISGTQDWRLYTFTNLVTGTRNIAWSFSSPGPGIEPAIAGTAWLDQVTWKPTALTFNTSPALRDASPDYGQIAIAIETIKTWTATSDAIWLTPAATSGTGNATLIVTHQPNEAPTPRSGIITITSAGIIRTCEIVQPEYLPLATALDNTLAWTTGGYDEDGTPIDSPWTTQTIVTHDGKHAARSGIIQGVQQPSPIPYANTGQKTWLETTATGAGTISFWWKVSSEAEASDHTGT